MVCKIDASIAMEIHHPQLHGSARRDDYHTRVEIGVQTGCMLMYGMIMVCGNEGCNCVIFIFYSHVHMA